MCMGDEEHFWNPIFFHCFGCGIFIRFYNFLKIKKAKKEKIVHLHAKCLMQICDPYFFFFVVVLNCW